MTLGKLLKNICITSDYIDIINRNVEPEETIRLSEGLLTELYEELSKPIPYSRSWIMVQYFMKSGMENHDKLIKWLVKRVDYIDIANKKIILDE